MSTKPYPFQLEGVEQIEKFGGRALVAWEMGLGKSLLSLLWAVKHPEARPVVIVCPASLKWNWARECRVHLGLRAEILESRKPSVSHRLFQSQILIINYDVLFSWLKFLRKLRPKLVVLDEVHYIKNRIAQRSRAAAMLCTKVPYVLQLSGTPILSRPIELYNPVKIIRPGLFPSRLEFGMKFCDAKHNGFGWDFSGSSNTGLLHKKLKCNVMLRLLKKDVLKDLPNKIHTVVPFKVKKAEYNRAVDDFLGWLGENFEKGKVVRAARALGMVKVGYLLRLAAQLKTKSVVDWVENFLEENDGKLILFGVHKKPGSILHSLKERFKGTSVVVDGSVVGKDRQMAIDLFLTKKSTRLLLGNIKAAGVGWNAKGVSNVAFVEFPWTPGEVTQAIDRCHGIGRGQKNVPVNAYYLTAQATIEEKLCKMLQSKQETSRAVLDGKKGSGDLDLFNKLCRALVKGAQRG